MQCTGLYTRRGCNRLRDPRAPQRAVCVQGAAVSVEPCQICCGRTQSSQNLLYCRTLVHTGWHTALLRYWHLRSACAGKPLLHYTPVSVAWRIRETAILLLQYWLCLTVAWHSHTVWWNWVQWFILTHTHTHTHTQSGDNQVKVTLRLTARR
jgi:hypothetical protein